MAELTTKICWNCRKETLLTDTACRLCGAAVGLIGPDGIAAKVDPPASKPTFLRKRLGCGALLGIGFVLFLGFFILSVIISVWEDRGRSAQEASRREEAARIEAAKTPEQRASEKAALQVKAEKARQDKERIEEMVAQQRSDMQAALALTAKLDAAPINAAHPVMVLIGAPQRAKEGRLLNLAKDLQSARVSARAYLRAANAAERQAKLTGHPGEADFKAMLRLGRESSDAALDAISQWELFFNTLDRDALENAITGGKRAADLQGKAIERGRLLEARYGSPASENDSGIHGVSIK